MHVVGQPGGDSAAKASAARLEAPPGIYFFIYPRDEET